MTSVSVVGNDVWKLMNLAVERLVKDSERCVALNFEALR